MVILNLTRKDIAYGFWDDEVYFCSYIEVKCLKTVEDVLSS
jgi:hypothetical protein